MEEVTKIKKGTIKCPICKKGKVVAYASAAGESSIQCGRCRMFMLVNYDTMTATAIQPEKGVI